MTKTEPFILAIENLDPRDREAVLNLLREAGYRAAAFPEPRDESGPPESGNARANAPQRPLWESETWFLKAYANFPLPVAFSESETGAFVEVNEAFEAAFGRRREEVIGRTSLDLGMLTTEVRSKLLDRLRSQGQVSAFELEVRDARGRRREVLYFGELIQLEGRSRLLSSFLDITDSRRKDAELRAAGERILLLTNNLKEAVLAYGVDRRLQYVNPAIEVLTGYTAEELQREQFICWVHPDDRSRMLGYWDLLFDGASYENVEYKLVTKQGETKWVEASWGPLRDEHGSQVGVQGSERDITARKRGEQERAELTERLQQAKKLESVGRLAGGVAHDFNNLLTVINGYTNLALDQLPPADPLRPSLQEVLKAAERAVGLIRQLLAFGRGQILHPEVLSLGEVIRGMEGILRRLIGEAVEMRVELTPALSPLVADRRQVEQVLMNLAANARDAMPDGGRLAIAAEDRTQGARCDFCQAEVRPGEYVSITVEDTGAGMTEHVRQHLFEPFFTTKETGKGTGLGLATVHGVVSQSGGHICVESEPGRGAVFHVFLPADPGR